MRHENHNKRLLNINELIGFGGGMIRTRSFTLEEKQVLFELAFFVFIVF